MSVAAHAYANPRADLSLADLESLALQWIDDGEWRNFSPHTLTARGIATRGLLWFLRERGLERCGAAEIRAFLAYLSRDPGPEGRWGQARCRGRLRPKSVHLYYRNLRTFCAWLLENEHVDVSPMARLAPPIARDDQVQPFTSEQLTALLAAARRTRSPLRDETIVLFLLDTGARAAELVGLNLGDLDMRSVPPRATVRGKGDKVRTLPMGMALSRMMRAYLRTMPDDRRAEALFRAQRGRSADLGITVAGLDQLIRRLGRDAGISERCYPHRLRHTFAISFLRAGGNMLTLKELLGHESLRIVARYVALAEADILTQHRRCSPGDALLRGKGR